MEERFRPLTFHGLVLRSQLVTLLLRGACYSVSQSVRPRTRTPSSVPAEARRMFSFSILLHAFILFICGT